MVESAFALKSQSFHSNPLILKYASLNPLQSFHIFKNKDSVEDRNAKIDTLYKSLIFLALSLAWTKLLYDDEK